MNPTDDDLKVAMAFVEQSEASGRVKAEFAALGRAPLSIVIAEMLSTTASTHLKPYLESIANLNQGDIDELDASEFGSYVLRKTGLTDSLFRDCKLALRSYLATRRIASPSTHILLAARTEDGTTRESVSAADITRELNRRA